MVIINGKVFGNNVIIVDEWGNSGNSRGDSACKIIPNNSIISKSAVIINNFSTGSNDARMPDVRIPDKVFEKIHVESKNGDIDLS